MTAFYGDWVQVYSWLNGLKVAPMGESSNALENLGKAIQKKVKQHITDQDIDWVPLSSYTIQKKGHDRIYLETLEYTKKIDFDVLKSSASKWELIVYPKGDHQASGLSMQLLAMYLEYGTKSIPARPLWRVVFEELETMDELKALSSVSTFFGG